jgi:hypothetical protein
MDRKAEVITFFTNYFKSILDNYTNESFWKVEHEIKFLKDIFVSIYCEPKDSFHIQPIQQMFPNYTSHDNFKRYYIQYYEGSNFKEHIGNYLSFNNIFYELFKIISNVIMDKKLKLSPSYFENIINEYEKNPETIKNSQHFYTSFLVSIKNEITKKTLNNLIIDVLNLYYNNYEEFISSFGYNHQLKYDISQVQSKYSYTNGTETIALNTFDKININSSYQYLITTCYNISNEYYNDMYEIFKNHYQLLLNNNKKLEDNKIIKNDENHDNKTSKKAIKNN